MKSLNPDPVYEKIYRKELKQIEKRISALFINKKPESLYDPCAYVMSGGGKRIRPFLVLTSAKAVGGDFKKAYNAALAIELLHNFTLAHDDIMDNAEIRRGRPTVHIRYDISTAVLAGDNLVAMAYANLIKGLGKNVHEVVAEFTRGIIEICEGQSLDKEFETQKKVTIAEYKNMILKKTAALLETSCVIGAYIGGGNKRQVSRLKNYARNLGMAFQIQDDLLDITADEFSFGKKIGGDLIEGKKTYLFLKALELASGRDKELLLRVIRNKGIDPREVGKYKEMYIKLGVIDIAKKEISSYTKRALKSISDISLKEGEAVLQWLANTLINRNK